MLYKVLMIYGAKIILGNIQYEQLKLYLERHRPLKTDEKNLHNMKGYVFTLIHNIKTIKERQSVRLQSCGMVKNTDVSAN